MYNIHIAGNHEFAPTFKKRYASKQTTTNACIHYCLCLMYFEHIYRFGAYTREHGYYDY